MKNNSQFIRKNILSRLREKYIDFDESYQICSDNPKKSFTKEMKVKKFKKNIEAARAEVYLCNGNNWYDILSSIIKEKK